VCNGEVAELVLASTGPELRALVTDVELGGEMSGAVLEFHPQAKFRQGAAMLELQRCSNSEHGGVL